VKSRRLSQRTMSNIRQNLFFALFLLRSRSAARSGRSVPVFWTTAESHHRSRGHEFQLSLSHWKLLKTSNS
jgi:hypothetical protein